MQGMVEYLEPSSMGRIHVGIPTRTWKKLHANSESYVKTGLLRLELSFDPFGVRIFA